MAPRDRRIALLIETDDTCGRTIVEAIARFAHDHRWALLIAPRDAQRRLRLPRKWNGDGAIVTLRDQSTANHLRRASIPVVDIATIMLEETWMGRVNTDDHLRAKLAFDHFRSKHLEHFAYYAPPIGRYSNQRVLAFQREVERAGFSCVGIDGTERRGHRRHSEFEFVAQWLRSLNHPLAVFAADPFSARQLAEICESNGIRIPDEVALLAGDTDDLLCQIASPPISSIELAYHRIGIEACKLLKGMMEGEPAPPRPKLIPPVRVIARHSTDVLAIDDPEIADILRFIRSRAREGIRVSDILRAFPVSRRSLELRFRQLLGVSPAEEIRKTRLEQARQMLAETDMSVSAVAAACGISSAVELAHAFRRYFGIRPTAVRARLGAGREGAV